MSKPSAIVIGAGIVGLSTARALAIRGYKVSVFERSSRPVGASIRNFGMIWPIGQPLGIMYERAMLSRSIWKSITESAKIWHEESGSLHLAYYEDEFGVLKEFVAANEHLRDCKMLSSGEILKLSPTVNAKGLLGGLFSREEMIIEPRIAMMQISNYLKEKYNVNFFWDTAITKVEEHKVRSGKFKWRADEIYICSGSDFETLYPDLYKTTEITKCKLQMMRMSCMSENQNIGASLCGGLSLIHYPSFKRCPSLPFLQARFEKEYPEYIKLGIHVMVSQNGSGDLTIGDSHEYGLTFDPFDHASINKLILDYLKTFAVIQDYQIVQNWHGIYPKMKNGQTELIVEPEKGITIINGLGGNGMTLSFGLCEQLISRKFGN